MTPVSILSRRIEVLKSIVYSFVSHLKGNANIIVTVIMLRIKFVLTWEI